ncbi:unnamed protein product [Phytomonas sp. EM1]|nr:unnamed protein product [Phytomonas sp. EM1]|eukprot:CCW62607.1 unnamed protein product [Phytomonas sp. isolate EM1]
MGAKESHIQKSDSWKSTLKEKNSVKKGQRNLSTQSSSSKEFNSGVSNPLVRPPSSSIRCRETLEKQSEEPNKNAESLISVADQNDSFCAGSFSTANINNASRATTEAKYSIIEMEKRLHEGAPLVCRNETEPPKPMNVGNISPEENKTTSEVVIHPRDVGNEDQASGDEKHPECDILEVETPSDVESWSSISDNVVSPEAGGNIGAPAHPLNKVPEPRLPSLRAGSDSNDNVLPQNNDITDDDDDVLTQDGCHISGRQNSNKLIHTTNTTISNANSIDSNSVHGLARFPSQNIQCYLCGAPAEVFCCQQHDGANLRKECAADSIIVKKRSGSNHGMMCLSEPHTNNNRWNSESSVSTIITEAASSLLYDPCSVCNRAIDDVEHVHRCVECDFIVCPDCYDAEKVIHEHELRSFRRTSKSSIQDLTPLSNWSRKSGGNRIINNYVIIRQLGQGSYAKVKLVQNVHTGELFALKILRRPKQINLLNRVKPHSSDDDLLREVAVMKYIEHPNIVKLIEVIEDVEGGGRLYLIMEYCQRGPAHQLGNPPLPLETVRQFGRGILSGLVYLHSEFLYHRDIKPANCLVTSAGVVKLADFGTCNSRRHSTGMDGTPAFNSPEIIQGEDASGEIADSWAFALTLYQMASGTLPCEGMSAMGYRGFIRSKEPINIPLPSEHNSIDPPLHDLLSKMLNKDVKQRMMIAKAIYHPFFQLTDEEINSMHQKRSFDMPNTDSSCGPSESQPQQTLCSSAHGSSRVSRLYDRALKSVKCGRNLPEAFHGIKDIHLIHRKDLQAAEGIGSSGIPDGSIINSRLSTSSLCKPDTTDQQAESSQSIDLQLILDRIERQKRQNSQVLDLSNIQMGSPPALVNDVAPFTTRMRFVSNHLRSLTRINFAEFSQLKEISVICNALQRFPEEVLAAPHLVRLDLSHNGITEIPPLASAASLEQLNLHGNNISAIGLDYKTGQSVLAAPSLRLVRLSSNPILSLPMGLGTLRQLSLVLDAHPDLCAQWARIVEERSRSHAQPNLLFIVWDDYFPARVAGTDLPIWIASSNLQLYRLQTLQICECRHVVMFRSASPWFPIGRVTGEKLGKHFREIESFQLNARRRGRAVGDGFLGTEAASMAPPMTSLPSIVRFGALRYVKEYFFISDNEEDPVGGYCSLFNFISDTLRDREPIMFFMMCSHTNLQHTREIAVAALSEYLMTLLEHGTLKEQFDAVMASMRNFS